MSLQFESSSERDLPQLERAVRHFTADALQPGLQTHKMKSGLVSGIGLGRRFCSEIAGKLALPVETWMRNLGHEMAGGRVIRTQEKKRLQPLKDRCRKYAALQSATGRRVATLWRTGALPAAGHGAAVSGVSDIALRYYRHFAATLMGGKKRGGVTGYLIMNPSPLYDPVYDGTLGIVLKYATFS